MIYLLFALRRSGQHALANWICRQSNNAIFFNNCKINKFKNVSKYKSGSEFINNKVITFKEKNEKKNLKRIKEKNIIIFGFEDYVIKDVEGINYGDKFRACKKIVLVRDAFNVCASRRKRFLAGKTLPYYDKFPNKIWQDHCRHVFEKKSCIGIVYDKWFSDIEYRKELARELSITFTDKGLNEIYKQGVSSWDGKELDGKAQKMDVLNRWKEFDGRKDFWRLLDSKTVDIRKKYFA